MTSEWFINGLNLPIGPSTEVESVNRIFQVQTVYNFFPQLENPTASSFDYTITGYLYPEKLVLQLDQLAHSADTETVILESGSESILGFGIFAVKSFTFSRSSPIFIIENGVEQKVYTYTMVFTQFADQGENQFSIEGDTEFDEDAVGYGNMAELLEEIQGTSPDYSVTDPIGFFSGLLGFNAGT